MCLYSISAKRGNSHSTNLSYRSPTFSINRCFRARTRAASHGFKTRLSRNLISAGVKPSFSARDIHSSPPKGKKKQKYWVLAITYFKSLEFESSSRNLNDYLSLQCGHASEYYVSERMITIALVLFSIQSIFLEVKFTVKGVSRRDRTKVCYDACSSRLIIGFVGCWLQDISHRREGRGHKHLRMVLVDYTRKEEKEEEEEALSATLSEWIEKQRIIQ